MLSSRSLNDNTYIPQTHHSFPQSPTPLSECPTGRVLDGHTKVQMGQNLLMSEGLLGMQITGKAVACLSPFHSQSRTCTA